MRIVSFLVACLAVLAAPVAAQAQPHGHAVRPADLTHLMFASWRVAAPATGAARFVSPHVTAERQSLANYGPFRVLDGKRAALVGVTNAATPAQFSAMLRAHPGIATLQLVDCPGTDDDRANLKLGRMIRAAGLTTHVPRGGSVRSGAVELLLAGRERQIDDGAEFAVHSWMADDGREASDFAAGSPEHAGYLSYYREMGMSEPQARAFYAMTNTAAFDDARWLDAAEMRGWLGQQAEPETQAPFLQTAPRTEPRLAYLDLSPMLP